MKPRHIASRSNPRRRRRNSCSARDFTRSIGVEALRVANENAVSGASDTRVTDGAASLAAISCIAATPADQVGKR